MLIRLRTGRTRERAQARDECSVSCYRDNHKREFATRHRLINKIQRVAGAPMNCYFPLMNYYFLRRMSFLTSGFLLSTTCAHAHHLMGGKTPSTFADGLLSGLGHPLIGP